MSYYVYQMCNLRMVEQYVKWIWIMLNFDSWLLLFWWMPIYDPNSIHYAHDSISVVSVFNLSHVRYSLFTFVAFPFLKKKNKTKTEIPNMKHFQLNSIHDSAHNSTLSSQMVVVTRVWCYVQLTFCPIIFTSINNPCRARPMTSKFSCG